MRLTKFAQLLSLLLLARLSAQGASADAKKAAGRKCHKNVLEAFKVKDALTDAAAVSKVMTDVCPLSKENSCCPEPYYVAMGEYFVKARNAMHAVVVAATNASKAYALNDAHFKSKVLVTGANQMNNCVGKVGLTQVQIEAVIAAFNDDAAKKALAAFDKLYAQYSVTGCSACDQKFMSDDELSKDDYKAVLQLKSVVQMKALLVELEQYFLMVDAYVRYADMFSCVKDDTKDTPPTNHRAESIHEVYKLAKVAACTVDTTANATASCVDMFKFYDSLVKFTAVGGLKKNADAITAFVAEIAPPKKADPTPEEKKAAEEKAAAIAKAVLDKGADATPASTPAPAPQPAADLGKFYEFDDAKAKPIFGTQPFIVHDTAGLDLTAGSMNEKIYKGEGLPPVDNSTGGVSPVVIVIAVLAGVGIVAGLLFFLFKNKQA